MAGDYTISEDDIKFMEMAKAEAQNSPDPKTKVGAVIVDPVTNEVVGRGHNRMPKGHENILEQGGEKNDEIFDKEKHNFIVYGVRAAISDALKEGHKLRGCTLYTTLAPSNVDAQMIVEEGISRVLYVNDKFHDRDFMEASRKLLQGIPYVNLKESDDEDSEKFMKKTQEVAMNSPGPQTKVGAVREAYKKAIAEKLTLKLRPVRFNYVGLPQSGKTCFLSRLTGKFVNILAAHAKGKYEQPSTGVAENGGLQVITRRLSLEMGVLQSKVWSSIRDLGEESDMLSQLIYQMASNKQPSAPDEEVVDANVQQSSSTATLSLVDAEIEETFSMITKAIDTNDLDTIKVLLDDLTLLINTDTGGQAEFLDLQASLVQGPSFNLLFSRLVDNLDSLFQVYYTNEKGESTEKEYSTMTVAEVLFQTLSSIACFGGCFLDCDNECHKHQEFFTSKVMLVGTYLDLVTKEEFKRKDQLLQQMIRNTEFFEKEMVEFASEDQLMLAVNNMSGSQEEVDQIQKILAQVIERNFKKIDIPVSWLALSLYIRQRQLRVISLEDCEKMAAKFRISPEELQKVLWFLHHYIGVLLYFPEIEGLQDTVICDLQILYDSATNLITNVFTFDNVGKTVSEKFREKGQFSLRDVMRATSKHTSDLLSLEKLIKILKYRNILATIPSKGKDTNFFLPCVLQSARASDLHVLAGDSDPAPLLLCFDCGYVPVGIFPAMIANLVSQQHDLNWKMIEEGLYKNRVQFHVRTDYDIVTLISHPRYFEFCISRSDKFRTPTASLCSDVRHVIQSTLAAVTSQMNYDFSNRVEYKFGFECPSHPGREHLCVLAKETAEKMECLQNPKRVQAVPMQPHHQVWFSVCGPISTDNAATSLLGKRTRMSSLEEDGDITPKQRCSHDNDQQPLHHHYKFLSIGAKPELHQLMCLKVDGKELKIIKQVGVDWKDLGLKLGFTYPEIKSIENDTHFQTEHACRELLHRWLKGEAHQPVSWKTLMQALRDAEHINLASQLECFFAL